jgi:AAA ATPase domain
MHYKQFSFENFKGIASMTLHLTSGVTTLIGLNESGKTTILEAISCFSYGGEDLDVINPSLASMRNPELWIPVAQRANFNGDITIGAIVVLDDTDQAGYRNHMYKHLGLSVQSVPSEIEISEKYSFKDSRYVKKTRYWSLPVSGLKGLERVPRTYAGESREWRQAVRYLADKLPRIWHFPDFLFELPNKFILADPLPSTTVSIPPSEPSASVEQANTDKEDSSGEDESTEVSTLAEDESVTAKVLPPNTERLRRICF